MRKWAFIKNYDGSIGCWRYIDNIKELKRYPYILDAIDKYGYDDIMPVVINKLGGYHSVKPEDIINLIESETEPGQELKDKYMQIKNNPNFECGWIDLDGNTYSCGVYGHISLAKDLCEVMFKTSYTKYIMSSSINAPDDFLIQAGFIKIYDGHRHACLWDKVTEAGIQKLDELERKWKHL